MTHATDRIPARAFRACLDVVCSADFLMPVVCIAGPYALAVLVQDMLVPWLRTAPAVDPTLPLACVTMLAAWRCLILRRALAHANRRASRPAHALATTGDEISPGIAMLIEEVQAAASRLATAGAWLVKTPSVAADDQTYRRLVDLVGRVDHVRSAAARLHLAAAGSARRPTRPLGARSLRLRGPQPAVLRGIRRA